VPDDYSSLYAIFAITGPRSEVERQLEELLFPEQEQYYRAESEIKETAG
jgi:hypothetical protein